MSLREKIEELDFLSPEATLKNVSAKLNITTKSLNVNYKLSNVIPLEKYYLLSENTNGILNELRLNDINIDIDYEDNTLNDSLAIGYLNQILKELSLNSPHYRAINPNNIVVDKNEISFRVQKDAIGLENLLDGVKKEFLKFGLNIEAKLIKDDSISINDEINQLNSEIEKHLEEEKRIAHEAIKFNKEMANEKKTYRNEKPKNKTSIKNIPLTYEDIVTYQNTIGPTYFMIEGYVVDIKYKELKTGKVIAYVSVTDETDTILVKKFLSSDVEKKSFPENVKVNTEVRVTGIVEYDTYERTILFNKTVDIQVLGEHKEKKSKDEAIEKRIELHVHTKMSALDGLTEATDYLKCALDWGWQGIAITDNDGCYAIPDIDIYLHSKGIADFKPIYGSDLLLVDDDSYFITFNSDGADIDLREASYVVFDLEATGLSQEYDRIIEISAHKVHRGAVVEEYETLVNPNMKIPEVVVGLTSITDEDVKDAPTIAEALPKFLEFAKGSILVAHNAKYDVGMVLASAKRLGIEVGDIPVIDSLGLFKALHIDDVKTYGLKSLSKFYKVKQEHHHRATDDTRVTALCFITMLTELYQKKVYSYKDINSLIDKDKLYQSYISPRFVVLAKDKKGYKNMLKLVSDALTVHLAKEAKALKSVVNQFRDGILVGSGGYMGEIFELVLNRSIEEAREAMRFYDYIEVSPPSCYKHLFERFQDGEKVIEDVITRIINLAQEENKIVVATSDAYYLRPNLKRYRDILIQSPKIGGGQHRLVDFKESPSCHLRTTEEMLSEFSFLDKDLAFEIVVTNTHKIFDMIEKYDVFYDDTFAPKDDEFKDNFLHVENIPNKVREIVNDNVIKYYGENPHPIVRKRVDRELNSIISNGYSSVYYMSHIMVKKSNDDGYPVGSRGSVGSSLVATMMDITEVNPLPPHYICKKCHFQAFKMTEEEKNTYGVNENEKEFQDLLINVSTGYDLPNRVCPVCGAPLNKDGHDIPFETFLGFEGDKTPDIDLNFSGEYQPRAHEYIRSVFGVDNAFRAGTVQSIQENNAFGYVKGYCERTGKVLRDCEMKRIASYLLDIRRSTGQHPGGIVVVPHYVDIYDVTAVQYPADNKDSAWRTTHYDYHKFEKNLLKLDVLGHDDPTLIKTLMDYVHLHQDKYEFSTIQDIPIYDEKIYKIFASTEVLGINPNDLGTSIATYGVPEYGTQFVQGMLKEINPTSFSDLVKVSGLSHGTGVWQNNGEELFLGRTEFKDVLFKDTIGCRDDIMVQLMEYGLEPKYAFDIMEFVRKGKLHKGGLEKWLKYKAIMEEKNVPAWYIWSLSKIEYMFPKAHAIAYVISALRIAWFKVYSPELFYSVWLSKRAKGWNVQAFLGGPQAIKSKIEEIKNNPDKTATDDGIATALQIALEMTLRGIKFLPVDINISSATTFEIENGALRIPFVAVDKLGESVANDIVEKRNEKPFTSIKDVSKRTKLSQTLVEEFKKNHFFGNLAEEDKEETEGLFALL